jgi:hypothetical protein
MAGLVPAIHVFIDRAEDVDARHKAGHDGIVRLRFTTRGESPLSPSGDGNRNFMTGVLNAAAKASL